MNSDCPMCSAKGTVVQTSGVNVMFILVGLCLYFCVPVFPINLIGLILAIMGCVQPKVTRTCTSCNSTVAQG